ncbi:MAG: site-specific integrase [Oscillospiraceae bacterium]|nr:site-specific integrase [Oscillospiraceae bacterium]
MARYKKRADGLYESKINLGMNYDGSYKRKSIYGKTVAELEENIRVAKNLHEQGFDLSVSKPTVKEWAYKWLEVYKGDVAMKTKSGYETYIKLRLLPIHDIKIDKVRPVQLQEILQNDSRTYSQKSVSELYNCICGIFKSAHENRLTPSDLSKGLNKPKGKPKVKRSALTPQEQDTFIRVCETHEFGLAGLIMLFAGLRFGESIALTYGDLKGGFVNVNKTVVYEENYNKASIKDRPKTEAGIRSIPMAQPLAELLAKHMAMRKTKPLDNELVYSLNGNPYSNMKRRRSWDSLRNAFNAAWIEENRLGQLQSSPRNITAHMLRHTFITALYDAGIDIKTAQRWSGHSTVSVLMDIYTHLSEEKEKDSVSKFDAYFRSQTSEQNSDLIADAGN